MYEPMTGQVEVSNQQPTPSVADPLSSSEEEAAQAQLALPTTLEEMEALVTELRADIERNALYAEAKERQIEELSAELQQHRERRETRTIKAVLLDTISLYDDLSAFITSLAAGPEAGTGAEMEPLDPQGRESVLRILRGLTSFQDQVIETLERNEVGIFADAEGMLFQRERQRSIRSHDTPEQERDMTIARSLRKGFTYRGAVLRPQWVETYRYVAPPSESDGSW